MLSWGREQISLPRWLRISSILSWCQASSVFSPDTRISGKDQNMSYNDPMLVSKGINIDSHYKHTSSISTWPASTTLNRCPYFFQVSSPMALSQELASLSTPALWPSIISSSPNAPSKRPKSCSQLDGIDYNRYNIFPGYNKCLIVCSGEIM